MRLSTSWMYQQSLNSMISQQSALAATQNQVSTGNRINVASDDPAGAGQVVSLNHVISTNAQYSSTIDSATTRLNTEASTLSSINSVLDTARTLALQAVNGTLSDSDRKSIASQLSQIHDQLVQLANTTDSNGNALFAGTSTTKTPFQVDANGTVSYGGNDSQQRSAVGSGMQVATSDPGSGLFMNIPNGNGSFQASAGSANTGTLVVGSNSVTDLSAWNSTKAASGGGYTITFAAGGAWTATDANGNAVLDSSGNPVGGTYTDGGSISFNGMNIAMSGTPAAGDTVSVSTGGQQDIFSTLNTMISALQSGASDTQLTNVMSRQIESIDQTQSAISSVQVSIGGRLDTLQQQQGAYQDLNVTYQSALSDVQGADAYTAISNLSLQQTALQASQQMFAQMKSMSLFNYLK
ncbi:flagellar hook-associated protein 3 FlgL [Dyella jiangningensis]|uniref:flagellar hook-associated protein FlgL n=1 Tax=Dyella sp. AtDHG13 TaxID=1938897 RepID=UPI00088CE0BB|nr:flagellar hook-associated protein FlgL [Dyella sp. AtDHG13]PXV52613.1 flagellar hook-associated protein 3 FlgL [Dyella sp. AtDHG13]SDL53582.1 flagellar hook-associated protein 3 FlgL [Dyella jiangningensis]